MSEHPLLLRLAEIKPARRTGFVRRVSPSHVEAAGPLSTIGDICRIETGGALDGGILAEVVAIEDAHIVLMPLDQAAVISPDALVTLLPSKGRAPVGDAFAGRAINAMAEPIDGGGPILTDQTLPVEGLVLAPLDRVEPESILETGLRTIDGLLPIGRGQRIGVFAASGVGKTTLVRQLLAQVASDRCVLCLVGERGREVENAWAALSASGDRSRYALVAATSDESAALRVRAVHQALCLAEYWRHQGEHVVLVVDSVTRYAMALREIGLAAGSPPTLRAYTPNVFAKLPRIVERCGGDKKRGSITAIMAVLSETDDVDDPIVEIMKSLLDGHIVLSRRMSEQGRFPAIDVLKSVSRQAHQIMGSLHAASARRAVSLLAAYEDTRVMIESGVYRPGSNPRVDDAIKLRDTLAEFQQQRFDERADLADTLRRLQSATTKAAVHA